MHGHQQCWRLESNMRHWWSISSFSTGMWTVGKAAWWPDPPGRFKGTMYIRTCVTRMHSRHDQAMNNYACKTGFESDTAHTVTASQRRDRHAACTYICRQLHGLIMWSCGPRECKTAKSSNIYTTATTQFPVINVLVNSTSTGPVTDKALRSALLPPSQGAALRRASRLRAAHLQLRRTDSMLGAALQTH
jgi:hypothetical protein